MNIQKLRLGLVVFCIAFIAFICIQYVDYTNLSWANNKSNYLGIIGLLLSALASVISYQRVNKQQASN